MQCSNCGYLNHEGARFCRNCGRPLTPAAVAPVAQPAPPAPPSAGAAQPRPTRMPARLDRFPDPLDMLLALVGTGLGALSGYLIRTLLPRASLQLPPFLLPLAIAVLALLAAFSAMIVIAYGVFQGRADRRIMKLKTIIQKEQAFFTTVDGDLTQLLSQRGDPNAD